MDKALQACQTREEIEVWLDSVIASYASYMDALTRMAEISRNLALEEAAQVSVHYSPFGPFMKDPVTNGIRALMNTPNNESTK